MTTCAETDDAEHEEQEHAQFLAAKRGIGREFRAAQAAVDDRGETQLCRNGEVGEGDQQQEDA